MNAIDIHVSARTRVHVGPHWRLQLYRFVSISDRGTSLNRHFSAFYDTGSFHAKGIL